MTFSVLCIKKQTNYIRIQEFLCQLFKFPLLDIITCKQTETSCFTKNSNFYSSSRQNLVRTSPPTVLMIQICHLAHIFIYRSEVVHIIINQKFWNIIKSDLLTSIKTFS